MNKTTLVNVVGTSNPTEQKDKTATAPGDLLDAIDRADVERHEANAFLPPMSPDQYRRLKEDRHHTPCRQETRAAIRGHRVES